MVWNNPGLFRRRSLSTAGWPVEHRPRPRSGRRVTAVVRSGVHTDPSMKVAVNIHRLRTKRHRYSEMAFGSRSDRRESATACSAFDKDHAHVFRDRSLLLNTRA